MNAVISVSFSICVNAHIRNKYSYKVIPGIIVELNGDVVVVDLVLRLLVKVKLWDIIFSNVNDIDCIRRYLSLSILGLISDKGLHCVDWYSRSSVVVIVDIEVSDVNEDISWIILFIEYIMFCG